MLKKLTKQLATITKKGANHSPKANLIIFLLAFAGIGGIVLLYSSNAAPAWAPNPPHAAQCVENSPSKSAVRPGEVFTARIRIKNVGTSTFAPSYGVGLGDYRDGASVWNPSGLNLSGNVGPGAIATFNLTLRAPTTPGTYKFEWGVFIAYTGFLQYPCTGKTVTVMNPPVVSLKANGSNTNISVAKGSGLTLKWSVSNSPSKCVASGSWSGNKAGSGSENRRSDTNSAGKKTYVLACSNAVGSGSATRQVTVFAPSSSGGGSSSSSGSSGSSGSPSQSSNQSSGSSSSSSNSDETAVQSEPAEPPTAPTDFSATPNDDSTVSLTWTKPDFNGTVGSYELERSTDKKSWQKLGDKITDETYNDTTVGYQTTYNYRIRTVDDQGRKSDYTQTQVTTEPFNPNLTSSDLTLTNDEQTASVLIPRTAFDGDAKCSLISDYDTLPPNKEKYEVFAGPYKILCKTIGGDTITQFNQPMTITAKTGTNQYQDIVFYTYSSDKWQEARGTTTKTDSTLQLQDSTQFAVLAHKAGTPLIIKVVLILLAVCGTVVGILLLINLIGRIKRRRSLQDKYDDYYRKEHGY